MISTDKIVETFPYLTIPPIIGQPNYESISGAHLCLNADSASVQSHLGNSSLGLLFLTVLPAVYNTLSTIPFIPPVNPGPDPNIPAGCTCAQIADIHLQFTTATKLYKQYDTTEKVLNQLLLGVVDDMFVRSLHYRHIGYTNVTTIQVLTHLYITYAQIKPSDLDANYERMKTPYGVNLPIETFFDQIEDTIEFASAGNSPFTPIQVVNIAYNVIVSTGMFQDDYKIWKRKSADQKTWAQFNIDFAIIHSDLVDSSQTARSSGYQANNATSIQHETVAPITNLTNATQADRESMPSLTATVTTLTTSLTSSND